MQNQDRELLNELVIESREHLAAIEPDLLALEKGSGSADTELLNRIFRAVHSIKGGFGFFGMEKIKGLSHVMENVLDRLRSGKITVTPDLTDALFTGVDLLRKMIDDVDSSEKMSTREVIDRLAPYQEETAAPSAKKTQVAKAASLSKPLPKDALKQAVRAGKWIYTFSLTVTRDTMLSRMALWKKIGELIEVSPDPEAPASGSAKTDEVPFSVVLASILEPDLISAGVELPTEQILQVDVTELKKEVAEEKKKAAANAEAKKALGADHAGDPSRSDLHGAD